MKFAAILFALLAGSLCAQTNMLRGGIVRAVGQSTVSVKPDLARIDFSVVTQALTAQDASSQNAARAASLISQLQLFSPNADIRTLNYFLTPNYTYPGNGGLPTLVGYTVSNTIRLTTGDLGNTGALIDRGIQAGANQVSSLQFGLKDDQPARAQALRQATAQAKAHADAMAAGAGLHTGAFRSIQEGVVVNTVNTPGVAAPSTPIVSGSVDIEATVTIEVDLAP
ncbi:MAG: SIMPL domain-containing protein [Acidobacteriota bacterium]|nr:SIMPL domain-containing protein [Acidobacteriota bacterium]